MNLRVLPILLLIWSSCSSPGKENEKIVFAVASNASHVAKELAEVYERSTGTEVEVIIGSSGKLSTQIIQGAPFDIFLSADKSFSDIVAASGKNIHPPKVCALGVPVIWCKDPLHNLMAPEGKNKLTLAIPNPQTAPFGRAAMEYLKHTELLNAQWLSLVYTENASQIITYVSQGHAECGCTALSLIWKISESKSLPKITSIDESVYSPLAQMLVLLSPSKEAKNFYEFVLSEEGELHFVEYGYKIPPKKQ